MDEFHVKTAELAAVAVKPEQYPGDNLPEFVFAGRSNVGKSSLINTMTNRKALARTSQNPGKTRTINFFRLSVEALELYFVDLPGYGYAKISRAESEKWGHMIERYLKGRKQIRHILMLLDIRHEPSAGDKQLFEWLRHYNYSIIIVATKADKIKRSQIQKQVSILRKALGASGITIIPFSSLSRGGRSELWQILTAEISDHEPPLA